MDVEQRARELLAGCLDEWGHPCEAENVREGEDLESYESELRLISQLLCFGMDTADGRERAALTPPEGYVLVDSKLLGAVRVARLAILQKEAEAEQMNEPHDASMWADCAADLDLIAPRGILAARPEVKRDLVPGEVWITFDSEGQYEEIEYNFFGVTDAEQRMQRRAERFGLRSVKFVRAEK